MKRFTIPIFGSLFVIAFLTGHAFADTPSPDTFDPSLIDAMFRGIADGNWFLVAGPVLAVAVYFVRRLLATRWTELAASDRWGVAIAAVLAGAGALAHAWLAGQSAIETMTWLGALKVFVAGVASYVTMRKLFAPKNTPKPSGSSQAGRARLEVMLVLVALGTLVACGASAREKALRATYAAGTSAQAAFLSWDADHQIEIAHTATSVADGAEKLDAYADARKPVDAAFEAFWRTLAAAAIVNDEPKSLDAALRAFDQLRRALQALTGKAIP